MTLGDDWPLVVAGPQLRRVDATHVSVYLAFTEAQTVTVTVTLQGGGATVAVSPDTPTTQVGEKLHVVVATATATGEALSAGNVYEYNVSFTDANGHESDLGDEGLRTAATGVVYVDNGFPSFSLPPAAIADVNLVHGSCRKAHGGSIDMLATLDKLIGDTHSDSTARPHQLFLTGDQIYADDVADALLAMLTPAGEALLGWTEQLPGLTAPNNHPTDLKPGERAEVMTSTGDGGAGITTDKKYARSHLVGFGEFCAMYLFAFSPAIWPPTPPTFDVVFHEKSLAYEAGQQKLQAWNNAIDQSSSPPFVPYISDHDDYEKQTATVANFQSQLAKVRRALANIPTYTICDDHEVTDDWYMNRQWCNQVLKQPLGRRLVRNALLGYALFQAWGNTPDQFSGGLPGETLLNHVEQAAVGNGFSSTQDVALELLFTIPSMAGDNVDVPPTGMEHGPGALSWHYRVAVDGAPYEVLVFDTRTWRSFASAKQDPPELIGETGFRQQMDDFGPLPDPTPIQVTIAVVPGPIFDLPFMSDLKRGLVAKAKGNFALDVEPWDGQVVAQQRLLSNLFARSTRLVALAGDVHFSFAARMTMWANKLFENEGIGTRNGALAQFTCSPLSNEDHELFGSYQFTTGGFSYLIGPGTVPAFLDFVGYNTPESGAINIGTKKEAILFWSTFRPWWLSGTPAVLSVNPKPPDGSQLKVEDFRYQVNYLPVGGGVTARADLFQGKLDATASDAGALKNAKALLANGGGMQVVGNNALGRIRFSTDNAKLSATQELYWRPDDTLDAAVYSLWKVSLEADPYPDDLPRPPL